MYSFKIACRSSPLACCQVDEVIQSLKTKGIAVNYEILKYATAGDKDKTTPLTASPDNFFTDAIDQALLNGKADIAVHSAKDLPQNCPEGLEIFALTQCLDNKDAWVGRKSWSQLGPQPQVGTSSLLRQQQILQLRPDVRIVPIRGSIAERLALVKTGQVDGIVVAVCALKRLKLGRQIKDIFPWEGQPLQGQLAVVGRKNDQELRNLFSIIDVRRAKILLHCGTHPEMYNHLGQIIHWPMIDIKPVAFNGPCQKQLLQALEMADIIIFTSGFAVEHFFHVIAKPTSSVIASDGSSSVIASDGSSSVIASEAKQSLKERFKDKIFAVIGQQTKRALQKFNIEALIVPQEETAQGLCQAITKHMNVEGRHILLPRSSVPNPFLKEALSTLGAIVTEITVYANTKPAQRPLPDLNITGVIFTSPSTVRNFLIDYATIPEHWHILARGPVTLKVLQDKGYPHATSLS